MFERSWDYWLRVVAKLPSSPLPYMYKAADFLHRRLDETPAEQELMRMSFSEEMDERSIFAASL